MTARVLIDAGNLTVGGGVQVGASLVDELASMMSDPACLGRWPWLAHARFEVSEAVARNLALDPPRNSKVVATSWRHLLRPALTPSFDVSFTVFGPNYTLGRARHSIVGFADVTSLFPESVPTSSVSASLRRAVRSRISRWRFSRADRVVVEAMFVRDELVRRWGLDRRQIDVVPNVLNGVFATPAIGLFESSDLPEFEGATFCFISRAYPHKNHRILGEAARVLSDEHGESVRFALTLTDVEWQSMSSELRSVSVNLGPISVSQAPGVYAACDGSVFPSLLECFSVAPLEAMASGSPLIASDRPFVRDIAGDAALYFDPLDAHSLANAILQLLRDGDATHARVESGRRLVKEWPTARDRAQRYLDLISDDLEVLNGGSKR